MDNLEEVQKSVTQNTFLQHVFEFDDSTKNEMLNIGQYSILVIVPVVILNKTMKYYIPEADETKGTLEIALEILGQVILLFIGLFYIHRIATFLPTYSGQEYEKFNIHSIILVSILIISSLHTKLGEKTSILCDRALAIWNGDEPLTQAHRTSKKVAQLPVQAVQPNVHAQLPQNPMPPQQIQPQIQMNVPQQQQQQMQMNAQPQQQMPNFGEMEVMAANEGIGGGFGSMF